MAIEDIIGFESLADGHVRIAGTEVTLGNASENRRLPRTGERRDEEPHFVLTGHGLVAGRAITGETTFPRFLVCVTHRFNPRYLLSRWGRGAARYTDCDDLRAAFGARIGDARHCLP